VLLIEGEKLTRRFEMDIRRALKDNRKGFSLVELMIALVILAIVITGIYNIYIYMHKTWLAEDIKAEMQQSARVTFDTMIRDMMMMGYGASDTPENKIELAEPNQLQFREHLSAFGVNPTGEYKILYKREGTTVPYKLHRYVFNMTPTQVDQKLLSDNVTSLSFAYFDKNNVSLGATVPAASLKDIKRITVTMTVQSAKPMPGTNQYRNITLTGDISPRNLWETDISSDTTAPPVVTGLHVVDARNCSKLRAGWDKSTASDVAGYMIKYGTTSLEYTHYQDVPVSALADPEHPSYEFPVDLSPYTGSSITYYVTVLAYDRSGNFSAPSSEHYGDPYPNITGLSQGGDDSANHVRKPAAVSGFTATNAGCPQNTIKLDWVRPSDANVTGYRIFRSYTTFSSTDFPASESNYNLNSGQRIIQITKETESGDSWTGPRTDLSATSYTDTDPKLVGCKTYYYAICPVTCDRTRVMGDASHITYRDGRYTSAQYATTSSYPLDGTGPGDPQLSSRAGWKRVFLSANWPNDVDYKYTRIYFKEGLTPPAMPPSSNELVPDRQSGQPKGTFLNWGTISEHDIIFNSADTNVDLADAAAPMLNNNVTYSFRAISYDNCDNPSNSVTGVATTFAQLCGDDPCGAPTWSAATKFVWVSPAASNLDASTWDNNATDGQTQIDVGLQWTDVNKTDPNTALDFYGYKISKNVAASLTGAVSVGTSEWNNYIESAGLREGAVYYYAVQATDCLYQNITVGDPPQYCQTDTAHTTPLTYDYVVTQGHNISPAMWSDPIKPGRLGLYKRTDTLATHPEFNVASTQGEFHNKVRFYITNTSQGDLKLDWAKLLWTNTAANLKSITIGPLDDGSTTTYSYGLYSGTSASQATIGMIITNHGTGSGSSDTSNAIPVTVEFANSDNTINELDDMRNDVITLEMSFTNMSMRNSANGFGVSGYTTGNYNGSNPIMFRVSGGPSINYVKQNKPVSPTASFQVDDTTTISSLPAGFPEINGGADVTVTSNVTSPSTETISSVTVYYAYTDFGVSNPSSQSFTALTVPSSGIAGNDYSAVIPGTTNKGVWYYVVGTTAQGNTARMPLRTDAYYYYKQLGFDVCREVPNPPTNLGGTPAALGWTAPTTYVSGTNINTALDPLKYKLYRRVGLSGSFPTFALSSTITTHSYNDTTYATTQVIPTPVAYVVTAKNSCTTKVNESVQSNVFIVCPTGGLGCAMAATPADIYAGDTITLNLAVCSAANNGTSGQTGTIHAESTGNVDPGPGDDYPITEIGDTGTAVLSIPTTHFVSGNTPDRLLIMAAGAVSDTITFTGSAGLSAAGCSSATVHAYMNPCENTPAAPTVSNTAVSGNKSTLSWPAVTLNTDGSTVTYTAGSLAGDSIARYEVWYTTSATHTDPNTSTAGWSLLATLTNTTLSKQVSVPKNSTTYYVVRAVDTCGGGTFSAVKTLTN